MYLAGIGAAGEVLCMEMLKVLYDKSWKLLHNYDKSVHFWSEMAWNSAEFFFGRPRTDVWMDSGRRAMANIATESFVLELSQQVCLQEAKRQAEDAKKATFLGRMIFHNHLMLASFEVIHVKL